MGVCIDNYVVCGIRIDKEDCEVVLSPAEYEQVPVYDVNTGEKVGTRDVLKKAKKTVFRYGEYEANSFFELAGEFANCEDIELVCYYGSDCKYVVLGIRVGEDIDCGNHTLTEGEISLPELQKIVNTVKKDLAKIFSNPLDCEPMLHFIVNIG